MKNRLVFRILGALSASLIIAAVFVPYISVKGYSQSLWYAYSITKTLYLPIMIIVFGVIAVLVFSINKKIELAYASCGALLFFLITQSIPAINDKTFSSYSVGYYFLVIGTILTAIMAFLCGLKTKVKVVEQPKEEIPQESSILNQIDKLYDNQVSNNNQINYNNELNINKTDDVIQPIQTSELLNPIPNEPVLEQPIPISNLQSSVNETGQNMVQPVELNVGSNVNIANPVVSEFETGQNMVQPVEPNVGSNVNVANPVVSEFGNGQNMVQPVEPNVGSNPNIANPVVSEFGNVYRTNNSFINDNTPLISNETNTSSSNNNLDIFN